MSAEKVALTLALGLSIGIMPSVGITTGLLVLVSFAFRLNMIALQVIHYAVSFIQIILFVPFLKLGQLIFQAPKLAFDINNIYEMLKISFIDTFIQIWHIMLMGMFVWLLIAIPLGFGIYHLSLPFFTRHKRKMNLKVEMVKSY
jgi:uncharacterized protein (DUF2062 family)